MNQHEIRQKLIDAMTQEAENGVWSGDWLEKGYFILCARDASVDPEIEGRFRGIVQLLKARGDLTIEPHHEEGTEDGGEYIKITVTPRTC